MILATSSVYTYIHAQVHVHVQFPTIFPLCFHYTKWLGRKCELWDYAPWSFKGMGHFGCKWAILYIRKMKMGCVFVIFSFTMSNHGWCFKRTTACNGRVFLSIFNTFIAVHLLIFVVKPRPHFAPPRKEFSGFIFFNRILGFSVFYLYMCFIQICVIFFQARKTVLAA